MRIMAVDYGDVRTGVAFCDKNEILASPFCVVEERSAVKLAEKLKTIAQEQGAETIVVGLPRNMDGSFGYRCQECRQLGELLVQETQLPVVYQDERLTTVMAQDVLSANDVRGKKRKKQVDAVSAVLILQSFIDRR